MKSDQLAPFAHTSSTLWQTLLRRSVRLYLALSEPGTDTLEMEARLRLVEFQLMRHLRQDEPTTAATTAQAQATVEAAQTNLLSSAIEVAGLLRELSAEQAATPLLWAALPAHGLLPPQWAAATSL